MSSPSHGCSFLPLERVDKLHDGYFRAFAAAGVDLVLAQRDGVPTVLEGICPHAGHPLAGARIMGADLRCDMHGYRFDLRTGACTYFTEGPCRGLRVYGHAVQDGVLGVLLGEVAVPGQLGENPRITPGDET